MGVATEASIHAAYIHAIEEAEHYIYIEVSGIEQWSTLLNLTLFNP